MRGAELMRDVCDVSRETMDRLDLYAKLLKKWNPKINLVGASTLDDVWTRHFVDSAQLYLMIPPETKKIVDIGSGAGFPGLVLAVLCVERHPDAEITLIESDARKCSFLAAVAREMQVPVRILNERIEDAPGQGADVLTARALAPLTALLSHAERHLGLGGTALFLKGARADAEIAEAQTAWRFHIEALTSKTDPDARVLKIKDIRLA